jgi:putative copper export protein
MDEGTWLNMLVRWIHIVSATVAVGGTVIIRFAVLPALASHPNGEEVRQGIHRTFKRLIHTAIALLLATGFYNYLAVTGPQASRLKNAGLAGFGTYHPVIGVKIILSLVMFTIALLLLKPVPGMDANRKTWLSVNVVLGLLVLALAVYLRYLWGFPNVG